MSSTVGQNTLRQLLDAGIPLEDIRFDYLWYKPLSSAGIYLLDPRELEASSNELRQRIQDNKPNLVLFLGQESLKFFQKQSDVLEWSGHVLWDTALNCKTLYSFDPHAIHVQRFSQDTEKPGQYAALHRNHLAKVVAEYKSPERIKFEANFITAPDFSTAKAVLQDMLDTASVISYDIEVLTPYSGRLIDCIGLASSWHTGICIPFYYTQGDELVRYWRNDAEFFEILTLVKAVLESNIPKVAQNSQFDTTMLHVYLGITVNNLVWDTMVAAHNLYCDLPKKLGTLIALYTNLPYHKYMIHSDKVADRWEYNAADAVANLHVMSGEMMEFALLGDACVKCADNKDKFCYFCPSVFASQGTKHYMSITNPGIASCVQMHIAGVNINPVLREHVLHIEQAYMSEIIDALNHAIPHHLGKAKDGMKLNPNASGDKRTLFYTILGCPEVLKDKRVTADKNAMKIFLEKDKRPYVHTLAKALLAYGKAKASISLFKVEPDNNHIRTQYDVAGTDTGRLASKESDVMKAGTNLQNIAKGPQRQMIIPENPDTEEFALVDLYAAEAYLNALDAGELEMIEMISGKDCPTAAAGYGCRILTATAAEDYKIHNWMERVTKAKFPTECEKANYSYKLAKQTIHGLNYGVRPDKMSAESKLPRHVTEWQFNMYHSKFPGLQARMKRIDKILQEEHTMVTSLGRRRIFIQDYGPSLKNIAYAWPNQSTIGEVAIIAGNYLHTITDSGKFLCRPVLNTHDGLAIRINKGMREQAIQYILNAFRVPLTLNGITIIIPVSIGFGSNFNDMKDELVYFYK